MATHKPTFKKATFTKADIEAERLSRENSAIQEFNKFTQALEQKYDVIVTAQMIITRERNIPQIAIIAK